MCMGRTMQVRNAVNFLSGLAMVAVLCLAMGKPATAASGLDARGTALDRGFLGLYNLDFSGAHKEFSSWERQHPDDPVGPVSQAAGYLFSEFNRLGVLETQFFESDEAFNARSKQHPDSVVHQEFQAALDKTRSLAQIRLDKNRSDRDALFAMTMASGLQADYAALIEKRNIASLRYTKESTEWAQQLLAICNDCSDAHLATGFSKYIIGSMSAPVRWFVHLGGLQGDKQAGIADLRLTAEHGHYLAPFARILLAIAYVRDKDKIRALQILNSLRTQFPANTLFPREISRLQSAH
jgi:hypothetical protein